MVLNKNKISKKFVIYIAVSIIVTGIFSWLYFDFYEKISIEDIKVLNISELKTNYTEYEYSFVCVYILNKTLIDYPHYSKTYCGMCQVRPFGCYGLWVYNISDGTGHILVFLEHPLKDESKICGYIISKCPIIMKAKIVKNGSICEYYVLSNQSKPTIRVPIQLEIVEKSIIQRKDLYIFGRLGIPMDIAQKLYKNKVNENN